MSSPQASGAAAATTAAAAKKKRQECTFGVRHTHLDAKPPAVPMVPTLAPASMLDDQPSYRGPLANPSGPISGLKRCMPGQVNFED